MTKTLLITHNDLDAVGCAIVFKEKYPDIEIQYHDYTTITEISQRLLNGEDQKYDKVYFADISPEEKEGLQMLNNGKYFIIDHHKTRTYLKGEYNNVIFDTEYCGAFISYRVLNRLFRMPNDFIRAIDAWDSWKLDSKYREFGEDLNLLLGYYGTNDFISNFSHMPDCLTDHKGFVVSILTKMKTDYLNHKLEQAKTKIDDKGNKYWEVYLGEVQSGMGNLLEMADKKRQSEIKYLKTINMNDGLVSLYSIGDFDVSEIAKQNGGGGHAMAAGYTIKEE